MTAIVEIRHATDDNRVFIDMPDGPANPCTACGACCTNIRVSFYCGELESGSGGVVPDAMASKVTDLISCMKGTESGQGRCAALRGEVGRNGIRCDIYARRPSTCREFSAWEEDGLPSPACRRQRAAIGLPALPHRTEWA
jgi:Fe-S-cluster containining protein